MAAVYLLTGPHSHGKSTLAQRYRAAQPDQVAVACAPACTNAGLAKLGRQFRVLFLDELDGVNLSQLTGTLRRLGFTEIRELHVTRLD